jgi:spermidine synthase
LSLHPAERRRFARPPLDPRRAVLIGSPIPVKKRRVIPILIVLATWSIFCCGAAAEYQKLLERPFIPLLILAAGAAPWVALKLLNDRAARWRPRLDAQMRRHADAIDALPASLNWLWIALAAGAGLYLELVVIRFHGSCFQLFAFFKNFSLLSCFLGLGIGYTLGGRREVPLYTPIVLPMLAVQGILLHCLRFSGIEQVLHNPISEHLALGLNESQDLVDAATAGGFLLFIFTFNALTFIPLGQVASRLMQRTGRLPAYSWNLVGSLAGIGAFYALSLAWAGPVVWFGVGALALWPLVRSHLAWAVASTVALLCVLTMSLRVGQHDIYSPYQILSLLFTDQPYARLNVNHVYFQRILKLDDPARVQNDPETAPALQHYNLPYLLKPRPQGVLVVGAGTGNDVAAAVRNGAGHVDAVEIDPAIQQLGRMMHPEHPYQSPSVHAIINDARAHLRYSDKKYDLIVYGLLDSHTLLSSLTGVRLDSYIYTVEAFRDARARLKPGGMIYLSFAIIRGEIGRKLYLMLQEAFDGHEPLVLQGTYDGSAAFLIGDQLDRAALSGRIPPGMKDITFTVAGTDFPTDKSTDDWPFFYMPRRAYPLSYAVMVVTMLLASAGFIAGYMTGTAPDALSRAKEKKGDGRKTDEKPADERRDRFSWPCFLLGAGFMLLETKAITELALFYGSTWVVVGVVIAAILLMAFAANYLLMRVQGVNLWLVYGLLLASLLARLGADALHLHSAWADRALMTTLVTLPLFFAGLVFSTELKRSTSIGTALGSNLLGAMLGGCLEYNSMYFGYRSLYYLALAI